MNVGSVALDTLVLEEVTIKVTPIGGSIFWFAAQETFLIIIIADNSLKRSKIVFLKDFLQHLIKK